MDDNARSYATMIEIGNTIVSSECITEYFACDLSACRGMCCIEGDAGAPVTADEIAKMEALLPTVSHRLSHAALSVIRRQGVAYKDPDGDMVTSIVHGRNCVFTCYGDDGVCLCALEREHAESGTDFVKPLSCALYPIRVTELSNGTLALNYPGAPAGPQAKDACLQFPARASHPRLRTELVRRARHYRPRTRAAAYSR